VYSQAKLTRKPKKKPTFSQAKQDLLILALMDANDEKERSNKSLKSTTVASSRRKRYFVDLASNHATLFSNTYLLETNGWEGLCIEPNPIYWYGLASYRNCTVIGAFVGGQQKEDGKEVDVELPAGFNGVYGGIVGEKMDNKRAKKTNEKRNLISILTVFQETNVPKMIDYMSLDVEGAESIVMNEFPWDSYKFKFLTIERPKQDLTSMLNTNSYVKVLNVTDWGETLWVHKELVSLSNEQINTIVDEKGL